MENSKKISVILLISTLVFGQIVTAFAQENSTGSMTSKTYIGSSTYYDPSPWAQESIEYIKKLGIIEQYENYHYKSNITREDFCELIYKLYSHQKGDTISFTEKFSDTDNIAILKLAALGVINGKTADTFEPDSYITREEAAVVISKLVDKLELNAITHNISFGDVSQISSWAKDYVNKAAGLGILKGNDKNEFSPQDPLTFEQTMVILKNILDAENISRVTVNTYYNAPESIGDKNTIVLNGELAGEYIEIIVEGEIIDFEYVKLSWDDKTNALVEMGQIAYYKSIKDKTIILKTYMPEGIPSEKIKWKSPSGKLYEYIIQEYNLADGNAGATIFNLK